MMNCPNCFKPLDTSLTSCDRCGWRMLDPMPRQDLKMPPPIGFVAQAEHDRLMAEARNKALEDAAMCCEAEADKCDDAVKWNGPGRYARDCKAAAYAMRDRASAIRALKS